MPITVNDANVLAALMALGSDSTPVNTNAKSGSYAYSSIGSPSNATAGTVVTGSAFTPVGEKVTVGISAFKTGDRVIPSDMRFWLECDPAGSTNYLQVVGTEVKAADLPNWANQKGFAAVWSVRGGSCRVAGYIGASLGGTNGAVGFSATIIN